jgi:hypothetical protein
VFKDDAFDLLIGLVGQGEVGAIDLFHIPLSCIV